MEGVRATNPGERKLEVLVMQSYICTRLCKSILISIPLVLISYHSFAGSLFPESDTGMILLSDFCKENVRNLAGYSENEKSLAMIISRSYICTNGDDEPEDPPFPIRLSKSCSIVDGVAHLFPNEEKLSFAEAWRFTEDIQSKFDYYHSE